jgi:hypothetical protein
MIRREQEGYSRRRFLGGTLAAVAAGSLLETVATAAAEGADSAAPQAGELHVGAAMISITPDKPTALAGQMHTRISRSVLSPVTANVLALETRRGSQVVDQAIFVSCDLVFYSRVSPLERQKTII